MGRAAARDARGHGQGPAAAAGERGAMPHHLRRGRKDRRPRAPGPGAGQSRVRRRHLAGEPPARGAGPEPARGAAGRGAEEALGCAPARHGRRGAEDDHAARLVHPDHQQRREHGAGEDPVPALARGAGAEEQGGRGEGHEAVPGADARGHGEGECGGGHGGEGLHHLRDDPGRERKHGGGPARGQRHGGVREAGSVGHR
mmetsp:Transcript_3531/g.10290  ORF Transcript_3531/g.10290 Transcript_3531/m.10290 type:complete len:200 (+) Transcript_3531:145-744(+)